MGRQTQTRERLVLTAAELFWNQGYAQTGVSSIMKRARATSGSFYHFFPTKEDLLVAVLDLVSDRLESEVLGPAEIASNDPVKRIERVIDAYGNSLEVGGSGFGFPLGNLVSELGSSHEAARRRINSLMEGLTARITEWLTEDTGFLPSRLDGRELAIWVVATLEGAAVFAMAMRSRSPIDAAARQLRRHLLLVAGGAAERSDGLHLPTAAAGDAVDWKAW